jgi:3',5'-cyclic AMP phosphodiesterase CpdA
MSDRPFRLAHLTDPHVAPLPPFPKRLLASRRILGYLSWLKRRQRMHVRPLLDAVTADLAAQAVDHVAVTGDLVNLAIPGEFAQGAHWLAGIGDNRRVTFVPGNHDAYVPVRWQGSWSFVGPFMRGDGDPAAAEEPAAFPFVRRRGRVALVGVSTAEPNLPTMALGRIGAAQLRRLGEVLAGLRAEGCCRVLLLHHPPVRGMSSWRRRLRDAAALRAVLRKAGAELILCGHEHRLKFGEVEGPGGPIPVFSGPSASLRVDGADRFCGYLIHRIAPAGAGWTLEVEVRRFDPRTGACRAEPLRRVVPQPGDGRLGLAPVAAGGVGIAAPLPL